MERLSGIYKFFMTGMEKSLNETIKKNGCLDKSQEDIFYMLTNSKNCVSDENLDEIVSLCKNSLI